MRTLVISILVIFAFLSTSDAFSQYTFFKEKEGFAIEVSLENTDLVRLPVNRNSISSLAVVGDLVVGGTKANEGLSPFIFTVSLSQKKMIEAQDLADIIAGQRGIVTGFARAKNNSLYAGTIANKINDSLSGSGHLIEVVLSGDKIKTNDLGIPVKNEGVFALTLDNSGTTLYGLTYPSGIFFVYNLKNARTTTFQNTVLTKNQKAKMKEFSIKPDNYLSRALVVDDKGLVYGSSPVNKMFVFDPATSQFSILKDELPDVWGRSVLGQADALIKSPGGIIYGGNSGDGQLFELNTTTRRIKNLGKPIMMNRIRGLAFGADKKLYGIAGAPPGYAHFFSYDPIHGYKDYGNPQFIMEAPGIEQGIEWRGFRLGSIASSEDGKFIVLGEDESLSQLLIYPVGN
jgi:hypothetical protein